MSIKSKLVVICSIFSLVLTIVIFDSKNTLADGTSACPAFTSAMIDAAAMAYGLQHGEPIIAGDEPDAPVVFCHIDGGGTDYFIVDINWSYNGEAFVTGQRAWEDTPTFDTRLYSFAEQLTQGQLHACRAAILKSFVWKNYCRPALP